MPGGYFLELTIDDGRSAERVQFQIAAYGRRLQDLSVPFEQIGMDLLDDNFSNFAREGALYSGAVGRGGASWTPLAPSTIRDRLAKGFGPGPILFRTGELQDSLCERGAPGNVFRVGPMSVEVGSNNFKAAIHHYGAPSRHIPPRPLVGITWERRSAIVRRIGDYVRTVATEAGV